MKRLMTLSGLLFENRSSSQTILKNTFWLGLGEVIVKALKFLLLIYVARILGATDYGAFSFALAFVGLFAIVNAMGLRDIVIREFAKGKETDFYSLGSLKIILGIIFALIVFIGSFFITSDPLIRRIIWILALYTIFDNLIAFVNLLFRAREKMQYEALARILQALFVTGVGFLVIFRFPSIENLSYGYFVATLLALISVLLFFHFRIFPLKVEWRKDVWARYLVAAWPIALSAAFMAVYGEIDSVIMGSLNQVTEVGWYNAAFRVFGIAIIPISLITTSFYSTLSRVFNEGKEKFKKVLDDQVETLVFLTVPAIVGGIVLAPQIINFIYGEEYDPSILAFRIIVITLPVVVLASVFNQILVITNHQQKIIIITLVGAIVSIIANFVLIPQYSLYGAAIARVISFLAVFFVGFSLVLRASSINLLNSKNFISLTGALIASLVMYFVIKQPAVYNLHVVFSAMAGAAAYIPSVVILRKFYKGLLLNRIWKQ